MPNVQYYPYATGPSANIEDIVTWASDGVLTNGFTAGLASSAKINRAIRQPSFVAAALANFISQELVIDVLDDGNMPTFITNYKNALAKWITQGVLFQSFLSTNIDFYVGGTGASDTNGGLTAGAPWATLQHAANALRGYNLNGYLATIHCQGAFTQGFIISGPFAGATGANVKFSFAAGSSITVTTGPCIGTDAGASIIVDGPVTLSSLVSPLISGSDGIGLFASRGSNIQAQNGLRFAACTVSHLGAVSSSTITLDNNYYIVGGATQHISTGSRGYVVLANNGAALTVNLSGTPSFTQFVSASSLGEIDVLSSLVTFSGTATGARYTTTTNALINTNGGGASFLPGSSVGIVSSGGLYL